MAGAAALDAQFAANALWAQALLRTPSGGLEERLLAHAAAAPLPFTEARPPRGEQRLTMQRRT